VALDPAPVVQVTNAEIGRRLKVERERHAFAPEEAVRRWRNPVWRPLLFLLALAGLLAAIGLR
jgi:hypothetical protein